MSQNKTLNISIFILVLFHVSGIFGINSSYKGWFLSLTPLTLLLSTFLLFLNNSKLNLKIIASFLLVFLLGLSIEIIGVKTGKIFGAYHYGENLGWKFMEVPVTIGMNWAALCFAAIILAKKYIQNLFLKLLIAAIIPVAIDFPIETLCESLDFWYWENNGIAPLQNYIAWFVSSFAFVSFLNFSLKDVKNPFAPYYLVVQFLFFFVLNLLNI